MAVATATTLTGIRKMANTGAYYLAMLFALLGIVQIFLAGSGMFGHDFEMHVMVGRILASLAILVLILALVARSSKLAIAGAFGLLLMIVSTTMLSSMGWDNKWLGGLHALLGITSVILAETLAKRAFKNR